MVKPLSEDNAVGPEIMDGKLFNGQAEDKCHGSYVSVAEGVVEVHWSIILENAKQILCCLTLVDET